MIQQYNAAGQDNLATGAVEDFAAQGGEDTLNKVRVSNDKLGLDHQLDPNGTSKIDLADQLQEPVDPNLQSRS